jgi:hypothetical protein
MLNSRHTKLCFIKSRLNTKTDFDKKEAILSYLKPGRITRTDFNGRKSSFIRTPGRTFLSRGEVWWNKESVNLEDKFEIFFTGKTYRSMSEGS